MASIARGCNRFCVFWGSTSKPWQLLPGSSSRGGGSSITEKSPHASMHGHGPQPWEVSTCGVWPISSPPIFRGLGPAQYGSVSFVRAFSALPVQRGIRTPCHPHAPSICIMI